MPRDQVSVPTVCQQHGEDPPRSLGTVRSVPFGKVLGQGMVLGCWLRNAAGRAGECPWCCRGCGKAAGAAVLCHSRPHKAKEVAGSVSSPGQRNRHSQRWECRGWQREGSSWGNVSLSRMRNPLPLPLSCRVSCQRRDRAPLSPLRSSRLRLPAGTSLKSGCSVTLTSSGWLCSAGNCFKYQTRSSIHQSGGEGTAPSLGTQGRVSMGCVLGLGWPCWQGMGAERGSSSASSQGWGDPEVREDVPEVSPLPAQPGARKECVI